MPGIFLKGAERWIFSFRYNYCIVVHRNPGVNPVIESHSIFVLYKVQIPLKLGSMTYFDFVLILCNIQCTVFLDIEFLISSSTIKD